MLFRTILAFMSDPVVRSGGPRRYFRHLVMLANRGIEIILLVNEHILTDSAFRDSGIGEHNNVRIDVITDRLSRPRGGWALFFRRLVARQRKRISTYRPDIILIYGSCNLLAAAILKRICAAKCIFDPRDNPIIELRIISAHERGLLKKGYLWIRQMKERYFELVMKRTVDGYFFQTELEAAHYKRRIGFADGQYAVLANTVAGLETRMAHVSSRASARRPQSNGHLHTILFCGALIPRKGVMLLVRAIHLLIQEGIELHLSIAGSGSEEETIRRYIDRHDIKTVTLLGWVHSCHPLMVSSDLLVVPSLYDALPDVLLEAFSAGVAVIGSNVAGVRATINDERFLFRPGSVSAIADAIRAMHADSSILSVAQTHSQQQYDRYDFDWAGRFVEKLSAMA